MEATGRVVLACVCIEARKILIPIITSIKIKIYIPNNHVSANKKVYGLKVKCYESCVRVCVCV